jgi:hypothetical protein
VQTYLENLESLEFGRLELECNEAKFAGLASEEELGGNHPDTEVTSLTGAWESIFNMWRMPLVDWRDWLEVGGRGTWEKQKKRRHQPNPKARATFKQIPGQPVQQNLMWAKHRYRAGSGENYTVVVRFTRQNIR